MEHESHGPIPNRFADAAPPETGRPSQDLCACAGYSVETRRAAARSHPERQDTTAPAWLRLGQLIDVDALPQPTATTC